LDFIRYKRATQGNARIVRRIADEVITQGKMESARVDDATRCVSGAKA